MIYKNSLPHINAYNLVSFDCLHFYFFPTFYSYIVYTIVLFTKKKHDAVFPKGLERTMATNSKKKIHENLLVVFGVELYVE